MLLFQMFQMYTLVQFHIASKCTKLPLLSIITETCILCKIPCPDPQIDRHMVKFCYNDFFQ